MTTYRPTTEWDTPATVQNGITDQHLIVQRAGEKPMIVGIPAGSTAREYATILHGFDGYVVQGFGFESDDEHPADCRFCKAAEPMSHNYEPPTAEEVIAAEEAGMRRVLGIPEGE